MSKPKKREVILSLPKNIGAIQISNDLTLVERKIMNAILWNAFNIEEDNFAVAKSFNKDDKKFYSINISIIEDILGWDRYVSRGEIRKALDKLVSTSLKFNILKKQNTDAGRWNITSSLLSDVVTDNDDNVNEIYYAFSHGIKDIIIMPKLYGWINLEEQKNINSKYTLALLEYLQGSIAIAKRTETRTEYIALEDYKKLIAGDNSNYDEFKDISRKYIKNPLKELNNKTTLTATANFKKSGRKVTEISFDVKKEEPNLLHQTMELNFEIKDSDITPKPSNITTQDATIPSHNAIKINELMINYNISEKKRKHFIESFPNDYIEANLKYLSTQKEWKGKMQDIPAGLAVKAVEDNYANYGKEKGNMELRQRYIFELRIILNPVVDKTDKKFLRNIVQDYQIYKDRRDKEQINGAGLALNETFERIDFLKQELLKMGYNSEASILHEIGIKSDEDFQRVLFFSKKDMDLLKMEVGDL